MATIYLSSTFADLVEQRKAVYDALRRMRHDVVAMEHYVSADERPLDKCLKDVAGCDMYIGIFAWRYGFVPTTDNPSRRSITELEYREACKLGKPCLIFLLADDASWPLSWVDTHTREGKRGRAIQTLRKTLAHEKVVNYFHTSEELAALVSAAVTNALKETAQGATDAALLLRLHYLESVYEHYKSVKLPIGPADGLSLLAIFQPLTLRNDPLAAEDLEREKRRKLLGESPIENDELSFGATLKTVAAENAEEALARSVQKRIVILGGPGTGKTTTLKHLVGCAAKAILDEPENADLPLPIFISLPDLARTHLGLQGYLPHIVDELKIDVSFADDLWQAINTGCAFLCLDSLDEVDPRVRGDLIERINTWTADARNTWVVGSRFTEYKGGQFRRGQFSEWELQPMNAAMRRELAQRLLLHLHAQFARQHHHLVTPTAFVELLEKHPHAAAWGENPLLFSLAAIVFVKTGDLPSSRAALYREIVEAVLRMREHDATECELLLRTLTKLALWLYEKKDRIFTRGDLVTFLEEVQRRPWNDTIRIANRIVTSGMMEVVAHDTYGFRHQTFQEYLAAVELARRLTHLDADSRREAWHYVWEKRTYSRWIEILGLLVGVLFQQQGVGGKREARRWISALIEQRETAEGDPGDLGLLLALKSLSEVMGLADEMPADLEALAEKIALMWTEALLRAARHRLYTRIRRINLLAYEVSHFPDRVQKVALDRLVEALKEGNRDVRVYVVNTFRIRKGFLPPLEVIKKLIDDESVAVSSAAIEVLGMFGESVPIEELVKMLDDPIEEKRQAAVRALGRQGERTPIEELVKMLADPAWSVRQAVVEALGGQEERAPVLLLVKMLNDKAGVVREWTIRMVGRQKERAPIEALMSRLDDAEWPVRHMAVMELGQQGERAPVEELVKMLRDNNRYVRRAALGALKGRREGIPIEEIVKMLHDGDEYVRREAVEVLGEQGEQAPVEELTGMLRDTAGSVCGATLNTLEMLGKGGVVEETFDMLRGEREVMRETAVKVLVTQEQIPMGELMSILDADDWQTRRRAIEVLREREGLAPIEVLIKLLRDDVWAVRSVTIQGVVQREWISREELVKLLKDDDWRVRRGVVEALGALDEQVPIAVLIRMLDDDHETVRAAAIEALGKQGERTPIGEVVGLLQDESGLVRQAVVTVLGRQGERTPRKELVGMLYDVEWKVCRMAARMLGKQGAETLVEELVELLQDARWEVRQAAVEALGRQGERTPIEELIGMLQDGVWHVRAEAIEALGRQGERTPIENLIKMLEDAEWYVQQITVDVLGKMEHWASLEQLVELLSDERASMRWVAVRSLETRGEEVPIEILVKMLDDENEDVCCAAIQAISTREKQVPIEKIVQKIYTTRLRTRSVTLRALGNLEEHASINAIVAMLGDENKGIRGTAITILEKKAPQVLSTVAAEARAIIYGEAAGTLLGSIQQYFIINVISTMGKVPSTFLDKLVPLLDWPHWLVRLRTIEALGKIRRNIPDRAIKRLLEIRLNADLQVLRDAADDALAEILSLETGIEDD